MTFVSRTLGKVVLALACVLGAFLLAEAFGLHPAFALVGAWAVYMLLVSDIRWGRKG